MVNELKSEAVGDREMPVSSEKDYSRPPAPETKDDHKRLRNSAIRR